MNLYDYSLNELKQELRDRGYVTMTLQEYEYGNDLIQGGEFVIGMMDSFIKAHSSADKESQAVLISIMAAITAELSEPESKEFNAA